LFGVSFALGAFFAGMILAESELSHRAAQETLPLRDAFAVLFFVSVGMLLDPGSLFDHPMLLLGTLAVVMIGKPLVAFAFTWAIRYPFRTSLSVSIALAQIGEFSFMLSRVGADLGVLTAQAGNALVAVAIVSIVANPILYRVIKPLDRWTVAHPAIRRLVDRSRPEDLELAPPAAAQAHRAIVIGYGPTGQTVMRLLRDNGIEPTIIEMNVQTVRDLRDQGIAAVYGDATQRETLAQAGTNGADSLILTSAGMTDSRETIRHAKELNPRIRVLARALYLRDVRPLRDAGAETVVSAEAEIALALTEQMLDRLGATPDQIDHERERVRSELRPA
jgi:CPA2 family monovalent cation:H+ antiporter-2